MIAQLSGTVASVGGTWVVVLVGGFGLKALCTPATASGAKVGHELTLHTSLVVREDSLTLYGFADRRSATVLSWSKAQAGSDRRLPKRWYRCSARAISVQQSVPATSPR